MPGYAGMLALTTKISAPQKLNQYYFESEPIAFWLSSVCQPYFTGLYLRHFNVDLLPLRL